MLKKAKRKNAPTYRLHHLPIHHQINPIELELAPSPVQLNWKNFSGVNHENVEQQMVRNPQFLPVYDESQETRYWRLIGRPVVQVALIYLANQTGARSQMFKNNAHKHRY